MDYILAIALMRHKSLTGKELKMKYWADITGNALSAVDSLEELGLTPESLNTEVARALRAYAVQMGYQNADDEDEGDYYRLAVEMRNEAAAEMLSAKRKRK